jgi:hypothetical protein
VLFAHQLFAHGVSLEAQYVFKDIVLVASGMVVAACASGARLELTAAAPAAETAFAPVPRVAAGPFGRSPLAHHQEQWNPPAAARARRSAPQTAARSAPQTAARNASQTAQRSAPATTRAAAYAQPTQPAQPRLTPLAPPRRPAQPSPSVHSESLALPRRSAPAAPAAPPAAPQDDEEYVPMYSYDSAGYPDSAAYGAPQTGQWRSA